MTLEQYILRRREILIFCYSYVLPFVVFCYIYSNLPFSEADLLDSRFFTSAPGNIP